MYRYRYINQLSQFGRTSYTLILDDLEGDMPVIRLEKEFGMPIDQIDNEFLYQEASKEIKIAQQDYNDQQAELAAKIEADAAADLTTVGDQ